MAEESKGVVRFAEVILAKPGDAVSIVFFDAANKEIGRRRGVLTGSRNAATLFSDLPEGAVTCSIHSPSWAGSVEGVAIAKPGRIYGMHPDVPGERDGRFHRVYTHAGNPVGAVSRVEFDADADEGMATVTAFLTDKTGCTLYNPEVNRAHEVRIRLWVRVAPRGEVVPQTPNAVLVQTGKTIKRFENDPLPDHVVKAMGGDVEHTEVKQ